MSTLTSRELTSIKDMVAAHQVFSCKLKSFAQQCEDREVNVMFNNAAKDCDKSCEQLIGLLK